MPKHDDILFGPMMGRLGLWETTREWWVLGRFVPVFIETASRRGMPTEEHYQAFREFLIGQTHEFYQHMERSIYEVYKGIPDDILELMDADSDDSGICVRSPAEVWQLVHTVKLVIGLQEYEPGVRVGFDCKWDVEHLLQFHVYRGVIERTS